MAEDSNEPKGDKDEFSEALDGIFEQGFGHPLTKTALLGALIGSLLGYAAVDGAAGVLLGFVFGGMIAILIGLED